jgi:circadian clock protein KaiC
MEKVKTGIEKLDTLLYGGFPKGRAYLISGEPGTGKTIFTLQFLKKGIELGERCIYISIDEKPEHIIKNAESLGWDLQSYLNKGHKISKQKT